MLDSWSHRLFQSILLAGGHRKKLVRIALMLFNYSHSVQHLVNELELFLKLFYQLLWVMVQLGPFKRRMQLLMFFLLVINVRLKFPFKQLVFHSIQRICNIFRDFWLRIFLGILRLSHFCSVEVQFWLSVLKVNIKRHMSIVHNHDIQNGKVRQSLTLKGQLL